MPSGKLAGISVKPFPRQSTMLLLQVQGEGQEMELALQDGGSEWGPVGPEHSGQLVSVSGAAWVPGPVTSSPARQPLPDKLPENYHQLTSPSSRRRSCHWLHIQPRGEMLTLT